MRYKILVVLNVLLLAMMLMAMVSNQAIWIIMPQGIAIGVQQTGDSECRWRVHANGVQVWCNGEAAFAGFGPIVQPDGRVLFEFNGHGDGVGIVLNNPQGSAISLTAERGCLVVRDERQGPDHVLGVIGDCEVQNARQDRQTNLPRPR